MKQVKRAWLDGYNDSIRQISAEAQEGLRQALREVDPTAPPDVVRTAVLAIMDAACDASADMAASVTGGFYGELRRRIVGGDFTPYMQAGRDPKATERAVRAILQKLFDGDYDEFEQECMERLDYEVKRASARCVGYNVRNDPYEGDVRWARVPTGDRTCDFCVMLASRGPVYLSEESAGAFDKFHAHCDCKVIPFWGTERAVSRKGGVRRTGTTMSIEGYDPDELYREYLDGKFGERGSTESGWNRTGRGDSGAASKLSWHDAFAVGRVKLSSFGEVQHYIREATSYEDLFDRIREIERELPYYHLKDSYYEELRRECMRKRSELINR